MPDVRSSQPSPDREGPFHLATMVAALQEGSVQLTAAQRTLAEVVSAALFEADPVGINYTTNTDEYDFEAQAIVIALPNTSGPQDVQSLTHRVFVECFDDDTAGSFERYEAVAHHIWSLWVHRR